MKWKRKNSVVYSCKYHVVWCVKYRRKVLMNGVDTRLREVMEQTCGEINAGIISMEIMPDHVHLTVETDPQYGIHRVVKQLKSRSSRILRQEFPELTRRLPTLWTNAYFVSTIGVVPRTTIQQYIEEQKYV